MFHRYVNPERGISPGAYYVHRISSRFLADKPKFADVAHEFLKFIGSDRLVIHNARFDIGFINAELARMALPGISYSRATDTVWMARRILPGARASLDALCERFNICTRQRQEKGHGALLDAELLYKVYVCLHNHDPYQRATSVPQIVP